MPTADEAGVCFATWDGDGCELPPGHEGNHRITIEWPEEPAPPRPPVPMSEAWGMFLTGRFNTREFFGPPDPQPGDITLRLPLELLPKESTNERDRGQSGAGRPDSGRSWRGRGGRGRRSDRRS